jgi:hypothetical protein
MDDKRLQLLCDKMEIMENQYKYARGIDFKDYDLLRSAFTDPVDVDFDKFSPGFIYPNIPAQQLAKMISSVIDGFKATLHQMTNFKIEVNGNEAVAITYIRALHYLPNDRGDNVVENGGWYINNYVRTDEGWKIRKLNGNFLWHTGNNYTFTLANEIYQERQEAKKAQ